MGTAIRTFEAPVTISQITLRVDNVRHRCPFTEDVDSSSIELAYIPGELCLESYDFHKYLDAFEMMRITVEQLAECVFSDAFESCKPQWLKVIAERAPVDGVVVRVEASGGPNT